MKRIITLFITVLLLAAAMPAAAAGTVVEDFNSYVSFSDLLENMTLSPANKADYSLTENGEEGKALRIKLGSGDNEEASLNVALGVSNWSSAYGVQLYLHNATATEGLWFNVVAISAQDRYLHAKGTFRLIDMNGQKVDYQSDIEGGMFLLPKDFRGYLQFPFAGAVVTDNQGKVVEGFDINSVSELHFSIFTKGQDKNGAALVIDSIKLIEAPVPTVTGAVATGTGNIVPTSTLQATPKPTPIPNGEDSTALIVMIAAVAAVMGLYLFRRLGKKR